MYFMFMSLWFMCMLLWFMFVFHVDSFWFQNGFNGLGMGKVVIWKITPIVQTFKTIIYSVFMFAYLMFMYKCLKCPCTFQNRSGPGAVPRHRWRRRVCCSLRPSLVEFHFIHGPHSSLHVLHSHEAFVQRQVVADSVLCFTSCFYGFLGI